MRTVSLVKSEQSEKIWAIICHLSALVGLLVPFGYILAPLLIWSIKKNFGSKFQTEARNVLSFCLSITLYEVILSIPALIFVWIFVNLFWDAPGGPPNQMVNSYLFSTARFIQWIFNPFVLIFAALKAHRLDGKPYPGTIKF